MAIIDFQKFIIFVRRNPAVLGLAAALISILIFGMLIAFPPRLLNVIQEGIWDAFYHMPVIYRDREPSGKLIVVKFDERSLRELGEEIDIEKWKSTILSISKYARIVAIDCGLGEERVSAVPKFEITPRPKNLVMPAFSTKAKETPSGVKGESWRTLCLLSKESPEAFTGHTVFLVDDDGIVRRIPLEAEAEGITRLALSVAVAGLFVPGQVWIYGDGEKKFLFAERDGYLAKTRGNFRPYFTSFDDFESYSYVDILEKRVDLDVFKGKVVLVGLDVRGKGAHYLYPVDKKKPVSSLVIQANAVNALITGQIFTVESRYLALVILVVLNLFAGLVFYRTKVIYSVVAGLFFLFIYFLMAILLFENYFLIDTILTPFSIALTFALSHTFLHAREVFEKKHIEDIFGRYLKREIVEKLVRDPTSALESLRGVKREITILFADIRGFTTFCEKQDSEKVVSILNRLLEAATTAIFEEDGTVDKYIGDGVMVFFNAPQDQPDHADRAVRAALRLMELVSAASKKLPVKLTFGIGINTGEAVIGNIGSSKRLEYTAIGDSVNLASRICSLAGAGEVLITENTLKKLEGDYELEFINESQVKGKTEKIKLYKVLKKS